MTAKASAQRSSVSQFREADIEAILRQLWQDEARQQVDDPFANPPEQRSNTLFDVSVDLDSLSVINVLLKLEPIVGRKLPVTLIKQGGYRNCDEMVIHIMRGLKRFMQKHRTVKSK